MKRPPKARRPTPVDRANRQQRPAVRPDAAQRRPPPPVSLAEHHAGQATQAIQADQAVAQGVPLHQAGRLAEAEVCYRRALAIAPAHPEALRLLGVASLQSGRTDEARPLLRRAVAAAPAQPGFWNTLGIAERAAGDLAEAAHAFARAGELAPEYVDAWANLAATAELLGDRATEANALDRLTTLQPTNARAWGRRGVLAYIADQLDHALAGFTRATDLAPNDAEAWTNLGAVQLRLGHLDAAEACQRRAVALRPDFLDAQNNLGNVLVARAQWADAHAILAPVVERAPHDPNAWVNLGHALKGLERHAEARHAFEQALALRPHDPAALVGLGDALQGLDQVRPAVDLYLQALTLEADNPDTHERLGVAYLTQGLLDEAATAFRRCLALDPDRPAVHSGLIFALDLNEGAHAEAWQERMRWNARFGRPAGHGVAPHANTPDPDRPLRIGYVSADFKCHSAAYLIQPIIGHRDRSEVRVYCYSGVRKPDALTGWFRNVADVSHETVDLSDDELETLIRGDGIDVLVDLSGHTGGNRLPVFARRPAPVQVTAWGYATGTGLDAIQYFLADPLVVPPEAHGFYVEEVVSLPGVICYEPPVYTPPVTRSPAAERGLVTFGAFNRMEKVSPGTRDTWARVLAAVPGSRLVIKTTRRSTDPACQRLVDDLAERGVDRDRIAVWDSSTHLEHLAAHGEIDILLDTFPHGGGVTSVEALLMGVPVVTLLGDRVAGRLAASFLTTLGLDDLVARTPDEYVAIAARLAGDLDRLAHERATLRERLLATPLASPERYTRAVETTYRELWRRWCAERGAGDQGRGTSPDHGRGVTGVARPTETGEHRS